MFIHVFTFKYLSYLYMYVHTLNKVRDKFVNLMKHILMRAFF